MVDAFNTYGPVASVTPKKQAAAIFDSTYVETVYGASKFAGLDVSQPHLQASPTTSTSAIAIQPLDNQKIVITGVNASTTQDVVGTPLVGTLAAAGSANDLVVYQSTSYNQFSLKCNIELPAGAALVHYRAQGASGAATAEANTLTVSYKIVDVI